MHEACHTSMQNNPKSYTKNRPPYGAGRVDMGPSRQTTETRGPCPDLRGTYIKAYQRFGLQNKFQIMLSPEIALELPSGADFGCSRHCKTNPVDLEGSRGQVLVVLRSF